TDSNQPPTIGAPRRITGPVERLNAQNALQVFHRLYPTELGYHLQSTTVRFLDLEDPTRFFELEQFPGGVLSLARAAPWVGLNAPKGMQVRRLTGGSLAIDNDHPGGLLSASPDGRSLLHLGSGVLELFAADTGQLRWRVPRGAATTARIRFSH